MFEGNGAPIVNAVLERRAGDFDASEGEVHEGVLLIRPVKRRHACCGRPLTRVVEVGTPPHSWGLWWCRECERLYSIGPKLPKNVWVSALARECISLYEAYIAAVAAFRDS
jgi:hypothetical protein